ncbi:MAG: ankyrin repeat domain-containing protein [Treponema sp.]|nr:ankyrin repeat domain-containing protein [Treponema sp.]
MMKKMMRETLLIAILVLVLMGFLSGCKSTPQPESVEPQINDAIVMPDENVWTLLESGDDKAQRYFLSEVEANARDAQGRTPLHIVAENKDSRMAAFFIALGADPNALDRQGRSPLNISTEKSDPATAKILAGAGADIHHSLNVPSPKLAQSPAEKGVMENGDFLKALLNPQTLESADSNGKTLLHLAAKAGSTPSTVMLLNAGKININRRDKQGKTPLDLALEKTDFKNYAETAEKLILADAVSSNPLYAYFAPAVRSSNYNIRSGDGMAPLHYLAREGYIGFINFVLEKKADVNIKNASGFTPLHEAARSGNIRIMKTLLDNGADVKIQDAKGNSVLHIAVPPQTHEEAVKLFLDRGADPCVRDEHGDSPLHIAVMLNRPPTLIRSLLEAGADVSIRNIEGKTALYIAVQNERLNLIPPLLEYNSDIFAVDNNGINLFENALKADRAVLYALINNETVFYTDSQGNTMLHITVRNRGNTDIINKILELGAKVNARNKEGDTALHLAVRLNERDAGELLLGRGSDIFATNAVGESPLFITFPEPGRSSSDLRRWMLNEQTLQARDGLGNTALHYMAQWQKNEWIPLVIREGADTEAFNATGETPLFIAVKQNAPNTITVLTANGANRDARDTLGNSVLHAAVRWNAQKAAEALLALGIDINAHALNGKTALHDSIRLGMVDIEKILLSHRVDAEVRDTEGNTAFMEAVLAGNPAAMERLVEYGAVTNTRNINGDTPLHIAAVINRSDISLLLLSWNASIYARNFRERTPFHNAILTSPDAVKTLLTKDRIYQSDDYGNSPLHIAIKENAPYAILRTIMDLGARADAVDSEGRTPLRLAVDMKNWEAAKFLADTGSDVFISARDGKSPADLVLSDSRAVQALFSGRAIGAKDNSGNTILHYAARNGNAAIIQQLIVLGANKEIRNTALERPADIALRWKRDDAAAILN